MSRLMAAIFIAGFFSALPLWGLSSQQGWITLTGTPLQTGRYQIMITRQDAFSKSFDSVEVTGARADYVDSARRRTAGSVRLILLTPTGRHEVMRDGVGNSQAIATTLAPLQAQAAAIDAAIRSRQPFTLEISPEFTFWLMVALVVLFAGAGLLIALVGGRLTGADSR